MSPFFYILFLLECYVLMFPSSIIATKQVKDCRSYNIDKSLLGIAFCGAAVDAEECGVAGPDIGGDKGESNCSGSAATVATWDMMEFTAREDAVCKLLSSLPSRRRPILGAACVLTPSSPSGGGVSGGNISSPLGARLGIRFVCSYNFRGWRLSTLTFV